MKTTVLIVATVLSGLTGCRSDNATPVPAAGRGASAVSKGPAIVIHGGAGVITPEQLGKEMSRQYEASLKAAADSGYRWLNNGIDGVTVVEQVIRMLESDTLFNAGRGAVLTSEGIVELDASIMRGYDKQAGAVSGVRHIEHPISLARFVLDSSRHVMLSGRGAEMFGFQNGMNEVDNSFFITRDRSRRFAEILEEKMGTVGVAVLDTHGNIAAGTSTGGMMMKEFGRIGDSPIIGAGTYADNDGCAVSCTGHGEYFIRYAVASRLSERVKAGEDIGEAGESIIDELKQVDGAGGLIAIDAKGSIAAPFNTSCMFRAGRNSDTVFVAIFR